MSYKQIHLLGKFLGSIAYYLIPKFRKRSWSNLSLATKLNLDPQQMKRIAKASCQNLMITCLEYSKLAKEPHIHHVARCHNPDVASDLLKEGKGVIFFCGHQANWEVLFLEGTSRMPGVAIGRPIKNTRLYTWILSIRTRFGGTVVQPKQALREGLKALKRGSFLGIVGDQAMPDSGYSSLFLGRRAWTSPAPALLAYRTGACLIVATTKREPGGYAIRYFDPIYPNPQVPMEEDVDRMMKQALSTFEETVISTPEEWMWQHNRWKQQTPGRIKRPFRHDALCVLLPKDPTLYPHLATLREIYPLEYFHILVPKERLDKLPSLKDVEIQSYEKPQDLFVQDYRFKLIFNWTDNNVRRHFLRLSAFQVVNLPLLHKYAGKQFQNFSDTLKHAILEPGYLFPK